MLNFNHRKIKLTEIIIVQLFCFQLSAQQYIPFPEDSAYWVQTETCATAASSCDCWTEHETYIYSSFADTIINGINYNLIKKSPAVYTKDFYTNPVQHFNTIEDILLSSKNYLAYRNDVNKKVYAIDLTPSVSQEYLWFDFDVKIGDTVNEKYKVLEDKYNFYQDPFWTVDSTTKTTVCDSLQNTIIINESNCKSPMLWGQLRLTEGKGFQHGFFILRPCDPWHPCITYDFDVYTKKCGEDFFAPIAELTSSRKQLVKPEFTIFPNPTQNVLFIESPSELSKITISDITGKIIHEGNYKTHMISVNQLSKGTYFLTVYDNYNNYSSKAFSKE